MNAGRDRHKPIYRFHLAVSIDCTNRQSRRSTEKGDNETVTMAGFVPLALLAVLAATLYGPVYQQLTIVGVSSGVRHLW